MVCLFAPETAATDARGGKLTLTLRARGSVFQRGSVDMDEISSRQTITIFYGGLTCAAQYRGEKEEE